MRFLVDRWKYGFEAWEESEMARWLLIVSRVKEAMAPTPVLLPGKSHGQRSLVGLQPMGSLRVEHQTRLSDFTFTFMHWRRKWHPRQCSCLENPRDGGAWWAAVYGVAQSQTRLRRLSSSNSVACTVRKAPRVLGTEHIGSVR